MKTLKEAIRENHKRAGIDVEQPSTTDLEEAVNERLEEQGLDPLDMDRKNTLQKAIEKQNAKAKGN